MLQHCLLSQCLTILYSIIILCQNVPFQYLSAYCHSRCHVARSNGVGIFFFGSCSFKKKLLLLVGGSIHGIVITSSRFRVRRCSSSPLDVIGSTTTNGYEISSCHSSSLDHGCFGTGSNHVLGKVCWVVLFSQVHLSVVDSAVSHTTYLLYVSLFVCAQHLHSQFGS